jgi:hypothetical protein
VMAEHVIEISEIETADPLDYLGRVECSCGWVSAGDWPTEGEARREGEKHVRGEPTEDEDEAAIRRGFESVGEAGERGDA